MVEESQKTKPAQTKSGKTKQSLSTLFGSKSGKMTKRDMQMAGSVVAICVLAAILVVAVNALV